MAKEMSSLERVAVGITGRGKTVPDMVPVCPVLCGATHRFSGISYGEWSRGTDIDSFVKGHVDSLNMIGHDGFAMLIDLSVEAGEFGQEVIFPDMDTAHPNYENPFIKTPNDYAKIKKIDWRKSGRMKFIVDCIKRLSAEVGKTHAIMGFVYGSLGTLSMMRGPEKFFMDLMECPEKVMPALQIMDEVLNDYAIAQAEAGAHGVVYDNLYASESILSKPLWEKFESKGMKMVCDSIQKAGSLVVHHNCGNGIYFDKIIEWGHPDLVSHAYVADDVDSWEEHKKKWGLATATMGWIPPGPVAMLGTPDEIEEECKAELEIYMKNGGYVLATGCEYGPNAPLRNAVRIVEARNKYGVYA